MNLIASQGTMRIESDGPSFSVAPTRPLLSHLGKPSLLNSRTGIRRHANGEAPYVLLFVPSYTRLIDTQIREIIENTQPDIVQIQCDYTVQWQFSSNDEMICG